jgi:transcription antitermination factor NusG
MTNITEDPRRWFCLRTATRREKDAAAALVEHFTSASLDGGSSCAAEVYLPLEKRRTPLRRVPKGAADEDAFEIVERPLIVGYIFVRCLASEAKGAVPDREAGHMGVEFIHAALEYWRNDGRLVPFPIASSVIEGLIAEEAAGEFDYTPKSKRYRPGKLERVRITNGPFRDYLATVIEMRADDRHVLVETKIGRLEIAAGHVEAA